MKSWKKLTLVIIVLCCFVLVGGFSYPMGVYHLNNDSADGLWAIDDTNYSFHGSLQWIYANAWTTGKLNKALNFSNTEQWINFGYIAPLESYYNFTFELWIKTNGTSSRKYLLNKKEVAGNETGYSAEIYPDGKIHVILQNSTTNLIRVSSATSVTDETWRHICVTNNGTGMADGVSIFIDGVRENSTIINNTLYGKSLNNTHTFKFGQVLHSYTGLVDEIILYNRILSDSEISDRYNSGTGVEWSWPYLGISLESPCQDCGFLVATNVTHQYMPVVSGKPQVYLGCELWNNATTSWTMKAGNSSPIMDAMSNQINYSYPLAGGFIWSIFCQTNETESFSSENRSLHIFMFPPIPPAKTEIGQNLTEIYFCQNNTLVLKEIITTFYDDNSNFTYEQTSRTNCIYGCNPTILECYESSDKTIWIILFILLLIFLSTRRRRRF